MKLENYRKRVQKEYDKWMGWGYPQGNIAVIRMVGEQIIKHCIPRNTPKLEFFDFTKLQTEGWDNIVGLMSRPQNILYLNPKYLPKLDFKDLWEVIIHEVGHYYGLEHTDSGMASHMVIA